MPIDGVPAVQDRRLTHPPKFPCPHLLHGDLGTFPRGLPSALPIKHQLAKHTAGTGGEGVCHVDIVLEPENNNVHVIV